MTPSNRLKFTLSLILLLNHNANAQRTFSLEDFLENRKTYWGEVSKREFQVNTNTYKLFKKEVLPKVSFMTSFPGYSRSITSVLQPDGNYAFRESNVASSSVSFSVEQIIPFTGGSISISNSIDRLDVFRDDSKSTSYSGSWLNLNLSQSLNFFNTFKWESNIADESYKVDEILYLQQQIKSENKITEQYFNLIIAKEEFEIIENQLSRNRNLALKVNEYVKMGRKIFLDSIQVSIQKEKLKQDLRRSQFNFHYNTELLNNLFISESIPSNQLPLRISDNYIIPDSESLETKLKPFSFYRNRYLEIYEKIKSLRLSSSEMEIKKLEANRNFTANLNLGFGFNNSSDIYQDLLYNPNQRQNVSLSIKIPIIDFNRNKLKIESLHTELEINKIEAEEEEKQSLTRLKFLYESYIFLTNSLEYFENKEEVFQLQLEQFGELYEKNRVSIEALTNIEIEYRNLSLEKLQTLATIYDYLGQIREMTLIRS